MNATELVAAIRALDYLKDPWRAAELGSLAADRIEAAMNHVSEATKDGPGFYGFLHPDDIRGALDGAE